MTPVEFSLMINCRDALLKVLSKAAKVRSARQAIQTGPAGGYEPAFVGYERLQMLAEVRRWQRKLGHSLLAEEAAIRYAERQANGHADYADKYALICAEVATGHRSPTTGQSL